MARVSNPHRGGPCFLTERRWRRRRCAGVAGRVALAGGYGDLRKTRLRTPRSHDAYPPPLNLRRSARLPGPIPMRLESTHRPSRARTVFWTIMIHTICPVCRVELRGRRQIPRCSVPSHRRNGMTRGRTGSGADLLAVHLMTSAPRLLSNTRPSTLPGAFAAPASIYMRLHLATVSLPRHVDNRGWSSRSTAIPTAVSLRSYWKRPPEVAMFKRMSRLMSGVPRSSLLLALMAFLTGGGLACSPLVSGPPIETCDQCVRRCMAMAPRDYDFCRRHQCSSVCGL